MEPHLALKKHTVTKHFFFSDAYALSQEVKTESPNTISYYMYVHNPVVLPHVYIPEFVFEWVVCVVGVRQAPTPGLK